MKNSSCNNLYFYGEVKNHVDPPLIPLIEINVYTIMYKQYVQIKLHINPTMEAYDMYENKIALF